MFAIIAQVILVIISITMIVIFGAPVYRYFSEPGADIEQSRRRTKAVDLFVPVVGVVIFLWVILPFGQNWWVRGVAFVLSALWWGFGTLQVSGPVRYPISLLGNPLRDCGRGLHFTIPLIEQRKQVSAARYRATEEIQAGIEKSSPKIDAKELKQRVYDALSTKLLRTRTSRETETGEVSGLLASYNFEFLYRMVYSVPFTLFSEVDQKKMVGTLKNFFEAICDLIFRGVEYIYIMEAIESDMILLADPNTLVDKMEEYWRGDVVRPAGPNGEPEERVKKTPREASRLFMAGHPYWSMTEQEQNQAWAAATPEVRDQITKWRPLPDERLIALFNANSDDEAVDWVFANYPTSTLARMIADTGFAAVYFKIEDRNEDPVVEAEKNAREQARLAKQTLALQAQGEGTKMGLKARQIVSSSGDACPHQEIPANKLTAAQKAEIRQWELDHKKELDQARELLLKTGMYAATQTVLTDGGASNPRPVVTLNPTNAPRRQADVPPTEPEPNN